MTREITCCFTGPRPKNLPLGGDENSKEITELKEKLLSAVKDAYLDGYRFFISGMADGFDIFAAEAVLELKKSFPEIGLVCAFPCPSSRENRCSFWKRRVENIAEQSKIIVYVEKSHTAGCEHLRNIYMADSSFRIIGWYDGFSGGTAHCWEYAEQSGIETVNLFERG